MLKKYSFLFYLILSFHIAVAQSVLVDEIISKHNQLMNYNKLESINTLIIKGYQTLDNNGLPLEVSMQLKKPDKFRIEGKFMQLSMIQCVNGQEGWMKSSLTGKNAVNLKPEQILQIKKQIDLENPLYNYKKKGYTATHEGNEMIDNTKCHKIKLTNSKAGNGKSEEFLFFVHEKTYQILQLHIKQSSANKNTLIENRFDNYKAVNDITLPFKIRTFMNGKEVSSLQIESYQFDTNISDSVFAKP